MHAEMYITVFYIYIDMKQIVGLFFQYVSSRCFFSTSNTQNNLLLTTSFTKEHHLLDAPFETWTFASGSSEREVASGNGFRRGRLFAGKLLGVGKALGEFSHDWL